ncbi:MAG: protein phosphatase 2C domain-containing protein [Luteolibacter sp.]
MSPAALLHWSARTHSGSRKPRNDDSLIVFSSNQEGARTLDAQGARSLNQEDLVFAVSDGMGGGNAGDLASAMLLRRMSEIIPETFKSAAAGFYPDYLNHLGEAIRSVHADINTAATDCQEKKGMAATLALAWFTPENLYIANVGDSRIYRRRNGKLEQLSKDHTSAWGMWKRGQITEIEYRSHPRRSALFEVIGGGYPQVFPHFAAVDYQPGDCFLLCTDGLIDGLWERHLSEGLALAGEETEALVETLLKRAIDNSGIDDTTLIVIAVGEPSTATISDQ